MLILTRQNLPTYARQVYAPAEGVARGGYIFAKETGGPPQVILMATGSELQLAVQAHETLTKDGIRSRVVSLPSFELFNEQPAAYRDEVLPPSVRARIGIEAGIRQCWDRYLGHEGDFVGLDSFGASAPFEKVYEERGLTAANVVAKAKRLAK
jgi:transketolase